MKLKSMDDYNQYMCFFFSLQQSSGKNSRWHVYVAVDLQKRENKALLLPQRRIISHQTMLGRNKHH